MKVVVAYGYIDLQDATRNFSEKLGGGGFVYVLKGTLDDSSVVAVNKLESFSQKRETIQRVFVFSTTSATLDIVGRKLT